MNTVSTTVNPGTQVGAERWPYDHAHPDCWQRPWAGEVLDVADPRAWANTIAFPEDKPNPIAVACHVARCQHEGWLDDKIPVLWEYNKVQWELPRMVRPYQEDVALWRTARELKRRGTNGKVNVAS